MKFRHILRFLCLVQVGVFWPSLVQAATPFKVWDKDHGAAKYDYLNVIVNAPTNATDGGFLLGGTSNSDMSASKSQPSKGGYDYWIVRVSSTGTKLWDRTFGGSGYDDLSAILLTPDGGFLLGGSSDSPQSGDKSEASKGTVDYWIIKIDANGNKQWDKTIGGSGYDRLTTLAYHAGNKQYVLGGDSNSYKSGDKSENNFADPIYPGSFDFWIVRIDLNGNVVWDKTVGSDRDDNLDTLFVDPLTYEYTLVGSSCSTKNEYKSENWKGVDGENDYWIIKLSIDGKKLWDNTIGGTREDYLFAALQTEDKGYLLGGISFSEYDGEDNTKGHFGAINAARADYWVVKVDAKGNKIWDQIFGGVGHDLARTLIATNDGGYIVGGWSESGVTGNKTVPSKGGYDYWIAKMDKNGVKQWDTAFGGPLDDQMEAMVLFNPIKGSPDYLLGGSSMSPIGGDKSQDVWSNNAQNDYWILRAKE